MFQMWGKLVENNHILQDLTVCIDDEDTRTHKVFRALDEICDAWNLAKPIWLDTNISEFKRRSKTRFTQDNFIESLEFDYLEIQITERLFLQSPLRFRRMSGSFYVFCPWICIPFIPRGFPCRLPGTKQYFSAPVRSGACGLPSMPRRCAA